MKPLMFVLLSIIPLTGIAADNMSFYGSLIAPPCKISNEQVIEVVFGNDLGVDKINGSNYKQPVKYTVDCAPGYEENNLAIVVDTTSPASFDSSAVQTNRTGLGIHILIDGVAATFAKRVVVSDPSVPPQIEAVPVQDAGIMLTEGAFEATMTLRIDYI